MKKIALLSMDVEDWYHLDYIPDRCGSFSMIDGLDRFLEFAEKNDTAVTLFVLSSMLQLARGQLQSAICSGHEIGLHGTDHRKPLEMSLREFEADCNKGVKAIEEALGVKPVGYRASCFSLDRERLNILKDKIGMLYDSSRIDFGSHPLYGTIDMGDFEQKSVGHFVHQNFDEFEMPTVDFLGKRLPISGGGYLRLLPWFGMSVLIRWYLRKHNLFSMYVHPFEMSSKRPPVVKGLGFLNNIRFKRNIRGVPKKMQKLVKLLKDEGYEFMTYKQAQEYYRSTEKQ